MTNLQTIDSSNNLPDGSFKERISYQVYQDIYNEITGKTEKKIKRFSKAYQYDIDDFANLDDKIHQYWETLNIKSYNSNVEVTYSDHSKTTYSSFSKFKQQNAIYNIATKSIIFEWNYLIEHSVTKKHHYYKTIIQIASGVSVFDEIHENVPKYLWSRYGIENAFVEIEYIDLMVAQNAINTITSWFDSLKKYESQKWLQILQKHSEFSSAIIQIIMLCFLTYLAIVVSPKYIGSENTDFQKFFFFCACVLMITRIGMFLSRGLGTYIENTIDSICKISYIKLNRGDDEAILKARKHNKNNWIKILASNIGAIASAIAIKFIVNYIY